jgi:hypothetical protein
MFTQIVLTAVLLHAAACRAPQTKPATLPNPLLGWKPNKLHGTIRDDFQQYV